MEMNFSDLNLDKPLLNALDDLGYTHPTTIQHKSFSVILSGRDVCGIAQTGTGKTLAYLLPVLKQLKFSKDKIPQVLIMVPTRELVVQVLEMIRKLTAYKSVVLMGAYGGVNMNPQLAAAEEGADIVVATPGRLLDLALNGALKLKGIKKLVIDEVDEMLNLGFRAQLRRVLDLLPAKRQNLMFSATMIEDVEMLIDTYFNAPEIVEAAPTGTPLDSIDQSVYIAPNFNTKVNLLKLLLETDPSISKALVFVATKSLADQLYEALGDAYSETVGVIHSNKSQNHRFNTVRQFKEGAYRFIIATDIIARGIDISEVTHVINFDLPDEPEGYIHRIGRTGRADKKGIAISFVTPAQNEILEAIQELMKRDIPVEELPAGLVISDVLTEDEKPKVKMKTQLIKLPPKELSGPAFHEKSAKNSKVNLKERYSDKMKKKYGKPIKRGAKKK
jgi:ATP-dependent RNA helicase RhlE